MSSELHRFGIEEGQAPDAHQWKQLCKLLKALITNPHLNVGSSQSEIVFPVVVPGKGGGGTTVAATSGGAFYGFYTVPDGASAGDIHLQGGTINGEAVDTTDLKIYDLSSDTWVSASVDDHLYVPCTGKFTVVDHVALPGFVISSAGTPVVGVPPSDTYPAVTGATTASSGVCNVSLGVFVGSGSTVTGFLPSRIGNRTIGLCITPPYSGT